MAIELASVAELSSQLSKIVDVESLVDHALGALSKQWGLQHSLLLVVEDGTESLVTLASHGYERQGVGAEVRLGSGIIGVAGARRAAIGISNLGAALRYGRATKAELERSGQVQGLSREIPLPGLPTAMSQLAVPLVVADKLLGVLCVESETIAAFNEETESLLTLVGQSIAPRLRDDGYGAVSGEIRGASLAVVSSSGPPLDVRYYPEDDSVFVDQIYVIKGLAGRILWKLLLQNRDEGRTEFLNRELRLDDSLKLPPVKDNLETRLMLLRRRLAERLPSMQIEKGARGCFRLVLKKECHLTEMPSR